MTLPNEEAFRSSDEFRRSIVRFHPSREALLQRLKNPDMDLINSPDNPYRKMKKDD